jgi:ribosome-binding protein aMBF1 (putative translation factor)
MNVTLDELKAEVLQDPEIQAEYERLRPEFELAETIIAARTAQGLTQAELAARVERIERRLELSEPPTGEPTVPALKV